MQLLVTCPRGTGQILKKELRRLDCVTTETTTSSVMVEGDYDTIADVNIRSRVANRVGLVVVDEMITDYDTLFDRVVACDWSQYIGEGRGVIVHVQSRKSQLQSDRTTQSIAHKSIIQSLVGGEGHRQQDDGKIRQLVTVSILQDRVQVIVDASGDPLYQRGYRLDTGDAPLKENVAAAILLSMGWSWRQPLLDPTCGSGTFIIEAAMMAVNRAPGLSREFGCERWPTWNVDMANKKKTEEAKMLFGKEYVLKGTDRDLQMIAHAKANADRAGVSDLVSRERKALGERAHRDGMIVSNPPYGKRLLPQTGEKLGSVDEMDQMDMEVFYEDLITLLEQEGTNGGFITSYDVGKMDLNDRKYETWRNGGEEVKLWKRK